LKLYIRVGFSSYQRVISALVLPGGYRNNDGSFNNIRNNAFFWSATENDNNNAWNRNLNNNNSNVNRKTTTSPLAPLFVASGIYSPLKRLLVLLTASIFKK